MLAVATVQWRKDGATFQASQATWLAVNARLRQVPNPQQKLIAKIKQATANRAATDVIRLSLTAVEADLVWSAATG